MPFVPLVQWIESRPPVSTLLAGMVQREEVIANSQPMMVTTSFIRQQFDVGMNDLVF